MSSSSDARQNTLIFRFERENEEKLRKNPWDRKPSQDSFQRCWKVQDAADFATGF